MMLAVLIFQEFQVKNTHYDTDAIACIYKDTLNITSFSMVKYLQSAAVKLGRES